MADIAIAMKEVNLASKPKTQGGTGDYALNDTDLVQLYDNAGNPNGKITKSALMDAVKASLPALLADQTTTGVNFPSINSSGVLGKMTVANLASVLGGVVSYEYNSGNLSNIDNPGLSVIHFDKDHNNTATDLPFNYGDLLHAQITVGVLTYRFQIAFQNQGRGIKTRRCWGNNNSWTTWKSVYDESTLTDSTLLSPLASALGATYNKELELNTDITSLGEGNYHTGSGPVVRSLVNAPSGADGECYIEVRNIYNKQYMYYRFWDSPRKMLFISQKRSSAATTLVWQQVYDTSLLTNSSLLSPLASALGVGKLKQQPASGYISDLNEQEAGTYCAANNSTLNLPSDASQSDKGYFCFGNGGIRLQVGGRSGIYHVRINYNNIWGDWAKI